MSALNTKANQMFSQMQSILENRATPIVESYHDDFYVGDRSTLASQFAPNSRYLWLLHPCGSHFGRIGVLPPEDTYMSGALHAYESAYAPARMELHLLEVNSVGEMRSKKISFREGHAAIQRSDYRIEGREPSVIIRHANESEGALGAVHVKVEAIGPGCYGSHVNVTTNGTARREDLVALCQIGGRIAAKCTGSLLAPIRSINIDGKPSEIALPDAVIEPAIVGKFKPALESSLAPTRKMRPR